MADPFRVCAGQVDFIDNGYNLQARVHREIGVGQGLRFNALGGIHHKDRALAGGQGTGNLIIEIHMAGGIDEVEYIILSVTGGIDQSDGMGLDGDASFPLQIHVVQELVLHLPQGYGFGLLQNAVRQSALAVIDVGYNAEIPNFASVHLY